MYILVVDVVVVSLGIHHLLQVMVVSHADRNMVRVGLTQIRLGVVSQIILILIEVQRFFGRRILYTIDMAFSIALFLEQFPTATCDFVSTRGNIRFRHRQ